MIYVAGYVAYKYRSKCPLIGTPTRELPDTVVPHWMSYITGIFNLSIWWAFNSSKDFKKVFNIFHEDFLSDTTFIFKKVASLVKRSFIINNEQEIIPDEVLLCLVRTRTYIRLRQLNKNWKDSNKKIELHKDL